ncbi:protein-serine/threonine phosphatase [Kosakonia sp.]|uniref:protein-serine/threonine phosphatase n=1 Tax=Kosakonia sp. TaxID=1916651 RepID=UPI0028A07B86|nr:protein-serine/threonine phosphatase [Kosakonia sp.]
MYQRIDGTQWRNIWIVGDLHGCHRQLMQALRVRHFDPWQDLLVCVGDVIDRGPESVQCLKLLQKPWFKTVRGNHEQMAIDALREGDMAMWQLNGGNWFSTLEAEERQHALEGLQRCAQLPYILELHCQNGVNVVAHADYPAAEYQWEKAIDQESVLWRRDRLNQLLAGKGSKIAGADHFWFGHTPLRARYDAYNLHYIDTGAVFGGELTLAQLQ